MRVIGLNSGTSADGVDAVLVELTGRGFETEIKLLAYERLAYPPALRRRLLPLLDGAGSVGELSHLNFYLGELFARAAFQVVEKAGVPFETVELIGSHGQTVSHHPNPVRESGLLVRSTLQIAELSVIAERTGVTTVGDFRTRDVAAGGQGAPLTPYLHYILFRDPQKSRLVANLGGICNVTYIRAGKGPAGILAFDTGPGNLLIDGLVSQLSRGQQLMDKGGQLAAKGRVHEGFVRELMRHPYLRKAPPKTTGRQEFGQPFVEKVLKLARRYRLRKEAAVASVTAFTARSIAHSCRRFILPNGPVDEMVVSGGGSQNATLMRMIKEAQSPIPVLKTEDFRLDSRALEAMAFALMAYLAILSEPNQLPEVTGASRALVAGKIVPGKNWPYDLGEHVIERLWKV